MTKVIKYKAHVALVTTSTSRVMTNRLSDEAHRGLVTTAGVMTTVAGTGAKGSEGTKFLR